MARKQSKPIDKVTVQNLDLVYHSVRESQL